LLLVPAFHSAFRTPQSAIKAGEVSVVFWDGEERQARSLAEQATRSRIWPGLGDVPPGPLTIYLAASEQRFDSILGRKLPSFVRGVTDPAGRVIVLRLEGDPAATLRHELAHMALSAVPAGVPRWFEEGYAAYAAAEWGRMDELSVSWQLVRGNKPFFDELSRDLLSEGWVRTGTAYALSETAVGFLARLGGDRGLQPLMEALRTRKDFPLAVKDATGLSLEQVELLWQRDLHSRYGWLSFVTSAGVYWGLLSVLLVAAWIWRRRRDRERRARLDEGWELPPDDSFTEGPSA